MLSSILTLTAVLSDCYSTKVSWFWPHFIVTTNFFSPMLDVMSGFIVAWELPPNLLTTTPFQINLASAPICVSSLPSEKCCLLPTFIIRCAAQTSSLRKLTIRYKFCFEFVFIHVCKVHERKEKWAAVMWSSAGIYSNAFATHLMIPLPYLF